VEEVRLRQRRGRLRRAPGWLRSGAGRCPPQYLFQQGSYSARSWPGGRAGCRAAGEASINRSRRSAGKAAARAASRARARPGAGRRVRRPRHASSEATRQACPVTRQAATVPGQSATAAGRRRSACGRRQRRAVEGGEQGRIPARSLAKGREHSPLAPSNQPASRLVDSPPPVSRARRGPYRAGATQARPAARPERAEGRGEGRKLRGWKRAPAPGRATRGRRKSSPPPRAIAREGRARSGRGPRSRCAPKCQKPSHSGRWRFSAGVAGEPWYLGTTLKQQGPHAPHVAWGTFHVPQRRRAERVVRFGRHCTS